MNRVRVVLAAWCLGWSCFAGAQSFPAKTLRIVVPAGPGSAVDVVARDLTPGLSDALGQQVIVENRPGGNSSIGAREVARAAGARFGGTFYVDSLSGSSGPAPTVLKLQRHNSALIVAGLSSPAR